MAFRDWGYTRLLLAILLLLLAQRNGALAQQNTTAPGTTEGAGGPSEANPAHRADDGPDVDEKPKEVTTLVGTRTVSLDGPGVTPTGTYTTYTEQITLATSTDDDNATVTFTGSGTDTASTTIAGNATETSGQEPPPRQNTQPCNNHIDLCSRKYSNVTVVSCHNSPFVRPGSSAANQQLDVIAQLDDGVRLLQAQMQWPTDGTPVPHFCHTSCDILDAGPITDWLSRVRGWVESHPYDVVSILLGNGNYSKPDLYAPFIEASGILRYTYEPPLLPMGLDDWPTLEQLIIRGRRVVMYLDYEADQRRFPWLVDQFSNMWETPFDPEDRDFPCEAQRPPNLPDNQARQRLFLMNHNLNARFNLFGAEILVPAVALLNETNAADGYGSLGRSAAGCATRHGRPPNFLNVDYYNFGSPPGSVFEVAARMNNVSYDAKCCGAGVSAAPGALRRPAMGSVVVAAALFLMGMVILV